MGADSLKLAVDLFRERLLDDLDAKLVIACHDELVVRDSEQFLLEDAVEALRLIH